MNSEQFEGVIVDKGKVTNSTFKVYIPSIMPMISQDKPKETPIKIDTSKIINPKVIKNDKIKQVNYITAKNATFFNSSFQNVNIFKMDSIDMATETETINIQESQNVEADPSMPRTYIPQGFDIVFPIDTATGAPIKMQPHVHRVLAPMKMWNVELRNINNFPVSSGDKCLLTKINGNYYVTFIFNKIIQNADADHDN